MLPTRWGKNQLTPRQWPLGCYLPKWCGGGSIFTKKAVEELQHFGRFGIQTISQEDVWFTGIARLRAGYSDATLVKKSGLRTGPKNSYDGLMRVVTCEAHRQNIFGFFIKKEITMIS